MLPQSLLYLLDDLMDFGLIRHIHFSPDHTSIFSALTCCAASAHSLLIDVEDGDPCSLVIQCLGDRKTHASGRTRDNRILIEKTLTAYSVSGLMVMICPVSPSSKERLLLQDR